MHVRMCVMEFVQIIMNMSVCFPYSTVCLHTEVTVLFVISININTCIHTMYVYICIYIHTERGVLFMHIQASELIRVMCICPYMFADLPIFCSLSLSMYIQIITCLHLCAHIESL